MLKSFHLCSFTKFCKVPLSCQHSMASGKNLSSVISELEKFAPISTAEKWDNVGLLIEPHNQRQIQRIILTNDLTENVLKEAVSKKTDLIISYHPPIFAPMKRITQSNWKERIVSVCLAESIAVYSPHTAWDAAPNGINDWLASALPIVESKPIELNPLMTNGGGAGRICQVKKDITLSEAIELAQNHIGLDVHVAVAVQHTMNTKIKTVAVCAGSGSSLLKGVPADLYITGEMSHHDVLDANHQNVSVILCNHSNSERGFIRKFKNILTQMLDGQCDVIFSEQDEDPLKTYPIKTKS